MTPKEALNKLDETLIGNLELKIVLSKALEKQIPKKPIEYRFPDTNRVFGYACPSCKTDEVKDGEYRYDYCRDCGQAIDWSDNE